MSDKNSSFCHRSLLDAIFQSLDPPVGNWSKGVERVLRYSHCPLTASPLMESLAPFWWSGRESSPPASGIGRRGGWSRPQWSLPRRPWWQKTHGWACSSSEDARCPLFLGAAWPRGTSWGSQRRIPRWFGCPAVKRAERRDIDDLDDERRTICFLESRDEDLRFDRSKQWLPRQPCNVSAFRILKAVIEVVIHTPYSSNMAPVEYFLFLNMKMKLVCVPITRSTVEV